MRALFISILFVGLLASCKPQPSEHASAAAKRYHLKGRVVSVDKAAKRATIEHDAVEGYMAAMTMEFPIHADWLWDDLLPGAEVQADLVVDNNAKDPYFLENVGIVAAPKPGQEIPPTN